MMFTSTTKDGVIHVSYDKSVDLKAIQADVLTVDTADNELITGLKKLKTDNKVITKAINALNEQLGNAQTSASDAVARVVALEAEVTRLQTLLNSSSGGKQPTKTTNIMGMVLVEEGNRVGTWARINENYETVEFNPGHGTWAGIKQVQDETYGEFTEIPITYVKTETIADGQYAGKNCWWIADGPADGFHVHPAFIGSDGQPHNLQIASWIASNKNDLPFSEDKGVAETGYWNNINYNDIHCMSLPTGMRPYSIYDHHFLARMMLIEFGTPDVQSQTVDGVSWDGSSRINYHGIYDPFGTPNQAEWCWLDGLTTLNSTYQVMAADGSRQMIETGVSCPNAGGWPINCRVDHATGVDFGDLFIANMTNSTENSGSFADKQNLVSDMAFNVNWLTSSTRGAFYLLRDDPAADGVNFLGWRVTRCTG